MKLLQNRKRFRLKQGRFPDDGVEGIDVFDIGLMPNTAHLACPKCSSHWFAVCANTAGHVLTGCFNCSYESIIRMPLMGPAFSGTCPSCHGQRFAIIKMGDRISIGCKRCSWEAVSKIEEMKPPGLIFS